MVTPLDRIFATHWEIFTTNFRRPSSLSSTTSHTTPHADPANISLSRLQDVVTLSGVIMARLSSADHNDDQDNLDDHDDDELSITPLPKRRKLVPVVPKPSPGKLAALLSDFGARKSRTSVSAMNRTPERGLRLRRAANVSYAESPPSAITSPGTASNFDGDEAEEVATASEDELVDDDTIGGE